MSVCLWTVGALALNSPAIVNFCFYISPTSSFFFSHLRFLKTKKKSVVVENKD